MRSRGSAPEATTSSRASRLPPTSPPASPEVLVALGLLWPSDLIVPKTVSVVPRPFGPFESRPAAGHNGRRPTRPSARSRDVWGACESVVGLVPAASPVPSQPLRVVESRAPQRRQATAGMPGAPHQRTFAPCGKSWRCAPVGFAERHARFGGAPGLPGIAGTAAALPAAPDAEEIPSNEN
jgi:hypothetical protein